MDKSKESPDAIDPEAEAWIRNRMREMSEQAGALTAELGLSPELKFSVMRVIFEARSESGAEPPAQGASEGDLVSWAQNRMQEMNKEAADVTHQLGLPPEATPNVMKAIYRPPGVK